MTLQEVRELVVDYVVDNEQGLITPDKLREILLELLDLMETIQRGRNGS